MGVFRGAGKALVFDDSFIHSVQNRNAHHDRVILSGNIWKPDVCKTLTCVTAQGTPFNYPEWYYNWT